MDLRLWLVPLALSSCQGAMSVTSAEPADAHSGVSLSFDASADDPSPAEAAPAEVVPTDALTNGCWPSVYDDAGPWGCHAEPALVSCTNGSTSVVCGCLSDAADCPSSPCATEAGGTCHDECTSTEYGLACGGIGPPPPGVTPADPPANCRLNENTPGGVTFLCCPCE